jgi:HK97 family phage major capsid protein
MSLKDSLNTRRLQVWEQAKAIADLAAAESRAFSGEEEQTWTRLNAELDTLDERIKAVVQAEQRSADIDATMNAAGNRKKLITGNEAQSEFRSFLAGGAGRTYTLQAPQGVDYRTLSKLSNGAGGYTVPTDFYSQLFVYLTENAAIMSAGVTVLNTSGGEQILVPKVTAGSTSSKYGETDQISASDPTFGQMPLDAFKYAHIVKISRELLADTGVDVEGFLARDAGRALGNALGAALVTGDGSGDPNGVHTASTTGKTGAAGLGGGFGVQDAADEGVDYLIDLFYSVKAPYRASSACHWMMADSTAAVVRKLKTSTGDYVWQPSVVAGTPDVILGKPVIIDPNVPAVAENAKSVLFGDFSAYFVRLAGGVRWERSDDFLFDTDQVTFRAVIRGDGDLANTAAIKGFVGGGAGS